MIPFLSLLASALILLSLPHWLPDLVISLRMWIFARVNGSEGIEVPGKLVPMKGFRKLYNHPAANGRSRGATLSDLFWYWLAPGPQLHQEHLEQGELYDAVSRTTLGFLNVPSHQIEQEVSGAVSRLINTKLNASSGILRLRDLMMPLWADYFYRLVFKEETSEEARTLIVNNANDVVSALKLTRLRHMGKRYALTRFLEEKIKNGEVPLPLPTQLSHRENAYVLQGVFFNTAIVQMSEAMTHLLLHLAKNPGVQDRLRKYPDDETYLNRVVAESLRCTPLFGIAHRITSADIEIEGEKLPAGSVLCFNYPAFHNDGYEQPLDFNPDRWLEMKGKQANYMPFGASGNRPCPAQSLALCAMRSATRALVADFRFESNVPHTRSIPHRGPVYFSQVSRRPKVYGRKVALLFLQIRNQWEDVGRSFLQLIFGSYMIWDAKRKKLCQRHFEVKNTAQKGVSGCPFHRIFGKREIAST